MFTSGCGMSTRCYRFVMDCLIPSEVQCPHCWEPFTVEIDTTQGSYETVEDCSVCCRPMTLRIVCDSGEVTSIDASP